MGERTKASDLRKEVINIKTGRRLGEMIDVEVDERDGKITAIVVPGSSKLWGMFGGGHDIIIPWTKIRKVGPDCILVEWEEEAGIEAGDV